MRVVGEWAADKFPARDGYRLGQGVSERILSGPGQFDPVGHPGSRPAARISSVTSSSE